MKKILAMAAAAALTCGVSAYAANPFSDVSPNDWAYQAVVSLSEQGVVEGYPDGTFKGQQNMTRYEMAQIIARMLAKEDQYNAEQRAMIDRLASEYADELNNLGVRVSALEKKVGNVRFNGDARMRYQQVYKTVEASNGVDYATTDKDDAWNGRIRIGVKGEVNDNTYVYGRFLSTLDFVGEGNANTSMDRLFVRHQFGDYSGLTIGRSELYVGSTGMFYDDAFDGVRLNLGSEHVNVEAGYGRFKLWNDNLSSYQIADNRAEAWYGSVKFKAGDVSIGGDYIQSAKYYQAGVGYDAMKVWGANINAPIGNHAVTLFGDYYKNTKKTPAYDNPYFYTAGIAFGKAIADQPGTFQIGGQYVKAQRGSYFGGTSMQVDPMALTYSSSTVLKDVKYWLATADVMLMKNVRLHGEYAFNVKGSNANNSGSTDFDDIATVSLNYSF
jgi:hypothetical protein